MQTLLCVRRLWKWFEAQSDRLRSSFWAIPAGIVLGAAALSYLAEWIDTLITDDADRWYLFGGGPEGARAVLETIAGSMMTFTGLVFSVTMLVLQLASTQFSPRALRAFLEETTSKVTLGVFVGTFVYALLTLRSVRGTSEGLDVEAYVPSLSIWLAILLVLVCVGAFIGYLHHVAQSIRPTTVLHRIAGRASHSMDSMYPQGVGEDLGDPEAEPPRGLPRLIIPNPHKSGVVVRLDEEALLEAVDGGGGAGEQGERLFVRMLAQPGDYVLQHAPLFEAWGAVERLKTERLTSAVVLGRDRNVTHDAAFGLRELLDVALRALSPSTNDPTTAVAAIDHVHDLLRKLVRRRFPSPLRRGKNGRSELLLPSPSFNDYVRLAFDELRVFSGTHFQITRRLRAMIDDLLLIAPPFRRHELLRQRVLLDRAVERSFPDELDHSVARQPDMQGH